MIRRVFELWPRSIYYWLVSVSPVGFWGVMQLVLYTNLSDKSLYFSPELAVERDGLLQGTVVATVALASFLYGTHRIASFHPYFDKDYRSWLAATPYTTTQPLPLGPVALDWRDALFICFLAPLTFLGKWLHLTSPAVIFLGAYLGLAAICLQKAGSSKGAWCIGFGLAAVVWTIRWPWLGFGIEVVLLIYFRAVLWRTLVCQHSEEPAPRTQSLESLRFLLASNHPLVRPADAPQSQHEFPSTGQPRDMSTGILTSDPGEVGWPLAVLGPYDDRSPARVSLPAAVSALVFAWLFGLMNLFPEQDLADERVFLSGFMLGALTLGSIARAILYCGVLRPPITFFGRLASGRIIILEYDRAFVIPLAAPAIAWTVYGVLAFAGLDLDFSFAVGVSVGVYTLLAGPPSIRRWVLTGHHRVGGASVWGGLIRKV